MSLQGNRCRNHAWNLGAWALVLAFASGSAIQAQVGMLRADLDEDCDVDLIDFG